MPLMRSVSLLIDTLAIFESATYAEYFPVPPESRSMRVAWGDTSIELSFSAPT